MTLEHYRLLEMIIFFIRVSVKRSAKISDKRVDDTKSLNRGFMALLCVLNYVLNKSGLVCKWYTVGVIVKETNIVILLVYMRLYLVAALISCSEIWHLGGMAVHKAGTDILHYFAILSVEARVYKYMTCFSVIVGKKYHQSHKTFGG